MPDKFNFGSDSVNKEAMTQELIPRKNDDEIVVMPSISGWIASALGLYLIGTGVFNIAQLSQGGSSANQQSSELLRQSGLESSTVPFAIVVSYVVGAPIFLGSGLLALGSIARHVKRSKNQV